MAIYTYRCETPGCKNEGVDMERRYALGFNPKHIACPECGNPAKRSYIGQKVQVHYKGDGWGGHPKG